MVYESSYESGRKPFTPDIKRGQWSTPTDFIYACWGLAFKLDIFSLSWVFFFEMGLFTIVPYLICLSLYVVPIVLIQSFLGQFSSSGFISAFRISPIFKGMGYISLALNFSILTYYSVFAAVPLLYLFHSFRPTLPWSCESFLEWSQNAPVESNYSLCNMTAPTTPSPSEDYDANITSSIFEYNSYEIPSVLFFKSHFSNYSMFEKYEAEDLSISWELLLCMFTIWALVALVFHKVITTEKMGKLIRYTIWLLMVLLLLCVTRFAFLQGAKPALKEFFFPNYVDIYVSISSIPVFAVSSFGAGWGAIVSLSSYNKFKTNIMRYSWLICLGQMIILMLFGMSTFLIDRHFAHLTGEAFYSYIENHWILYLSSASAIVNMEVPNMWSILFFSLMTIGSLLIIVTQLFALLTAIFDDFEFLRPQKQKVTFGLIGLLALSSIYFCTNHGLTYFTALSVDALFTQTALNLLLLLMVLWIYGRERFQRDIEFMLSQRFATWRVYVLRFVAPLALVIILMISCYMAYYEHYFSSVVVGILAILFVGIPWLFIPGYAIFSIFQTSGSFRVRFKRCCHPTDWYPVDPEERQRYEETMGNMDITHQLNEIGAEVL